MKRGFYWFLCAYAHAVWAGWGLPNPPASGMGDPGNFYLVEPGVTFSALNDDFIGLTDKLMTGSSHLALYLGSTDSGPKKLGFELMIARRFITPIIKTMFRQPELPQIRGLYADELNPRMAFSFFYEGFKVELMVGAQIFAHFGGPQVHNFIHRNIGSPLELHRFGPLLQRTYAEGSLGFGHAFSDYLLWMVYVNQDPIIQSVLSRINFKMAVGSFKLGLQIEGAYNHHSDLYDDIRPFRYGFGGSIKWGWYQATANYQSVYLRHDRFGQVFISPLVINLEF